MTDPALPGSTPEFGPSLQKMDAATSTAGPVTQPTQQQVQQYAPPPQQVQQWGGPPPQQYAQPYAQQPNQYAPRRIGQKRGVWGVWWLCVLTFGIYYCVWYYQINRELAEFAPHAVRVEPGLAVLAQFIPIASWVSLANTASRLNAASASIGSPVHVSGGMTVLSSFWFASQPRYLQRRMNALWDTAATLHVNGR